MFRRCLLGMFLLLSFAQLFGQGKEIVGDTAFWYRWRQPLIQELGLTKFEQTEDEFAFRFSRNGHLVEIKGTENRLSGTVSNYVFWRKKANKYGDEKTIHLTTVLPQDKVDSIYDLIQELKILELPTDRDIPGWSHGMDGVTYIMEFANQSTYTFKNYWTPKTQGALAEAKRLLVFIDRISTIVDFKGNRKGLMDNVPKRGCYRDGGMGVTCFVQHVSSLGYRGSTRLPIGIVASTGLPYLGKKYIGLNVSGHFQEDTKGNYGYSYSITKNKIFFGNTWSGKDGISYQFREKKLAFLTEDSKLINQQLIYGLPLKSKTSIAVGFDSFKGKTTELGLRLRLSRSLNNWLWLNSAASFFEGRVDYEIHISAGVGWIKPTFIRGASISLFYEQYLDYRDVNLSIRTNF